MQKKIAYGGVSAALCVILLAMSAYLPTLKAATLFLASVIPYVVYRLFGSKMAFLVYAASAILGFFLCQSASVTITVAYIVCFGNYPVFFALCENKNIVFQIVVKTVLYAAYFFAIYLIFKYILAVTFPYSPYLIFVIGIFVFAFYDFLIPRTGEYLLKFFKNNN